MAAGPGGTLSAYSQPLLALLPRRRRPAAALRAMDAGGDEWELRERVGRGSFGAVYRG